MPSPTTSLATQRPDLASLYEFDLEMSQAGFVWNRILPVIDVAQQSGAFGRIPIKQLLQTRDTARAPGAGYSRGDWKFEADSYATEEHGAEEPVDDKLAKMYRNYFDVESISTKRAFDAVLRNAEIRAAALIYNPTTFSSYTTALTNEWDDKTNATPIDDIKDLKIAVWEASGIWPDTLLINRKQFLNLRECNQIIDRLKYQGFQDVRSSQITANALAQVLDLREVIVAGEAKNSANEGQAVSIAPIWSDEYAMLFKQAQTQDMAEPCLGRTMHWSEDGSQVMGTVETYRDETVRGDIVRVRHEVQEKLIYVPTGHLISNVLTI